MRDEEQNKNAISNFYNIPVAVTAPGGKRELIPGSQNVVSAMQQNKDVYRDANGVYQVLTPSVTLNKQTGDIDIYAPQSIANENWFKEKYSNNEQLKQLSQAYKTNPNYKYETTDEDGNTVYKTVEELVSDFDSGLQEEIKQMEAVRVARDQLRSTYGDKVDNMSMEDIAIAFTPTYDSGDTKVANTTAIYLPEQLLNNSYFSKALKNLSTFDAKTGTVQRGDFIDNFWNRNNKKLTAERIQQLYQNLGTALEYSDWKNVDEDDYERHGSTEAAKNIAFRNFIRAQDPKGDFWTGVGDTVTGLVGGIGMGLADASLGLMNVLESANNALGKLDVVGNVLGIRQDTTFAKETAEGWDDWKNYNSEQLQLISDTSSTVTNLAELGTELVANIYIGNLAGGALAAVGGGSLAAAGLRAGVDTSSGLGKFMTGVMAGLDASPEAGKIIQSAVGVQKLIGRTGQLAGSIVNIGTQAVVDAALTDPVLFRKALDGDDGEETYEYLREQATWNVLGWAAGLGTAKIMTKFADTKFGRAVNAKQAKGIAKLKTVGYNVSDSLKGMISRRSLEDLITTKADDLSKKIDDVTTAMEKVGTDSPEYYRLQKQRTQLQNATLRKETEAFAKADIDIFDGLSISEKGLNEAEDYIINLKKLQNAVDTENRSLRLFVNNYDDILINPEMAGLNKNLTKLTKDYVSAERNAVRATGQTFTRVSGTVFSQEASNYIGATVELRYMESVIDNPTYFAKGTVASANKNIDTYREALKKLEKQFTPELKGALDAYIDNSKKWYASMNQYRSSKGILNSQDLEDLLSNPQFSTGDYMRVQRLRDDRYPIIIQPDGTRKQNLNVEFQHLDFAEMSDFMAPDLVQEMYKFKTARIERGTEVFRMRNSVNSASSRIIISGEDTQFIKDFKATYNQFNNQANDYVNKFIKSAEGFDPKQVKINYREALQRNKDLKATTKEVKKTESSIDRISTKKYRVNNDDRMVAVSTLTPSEVNDILVSSGKSQSGSVLQDGIDQFVDNRVAFREWYNGLPQDSKDTINAVRRKYNEYVGDLPTGQSTLFDMAEAGEAELKRVTYDNLKTLMASDPNLENTVNLQVLKQDKNLMKNKRIDDIVIENKRANERFVKEVQLKDAQERLKKLVGEQNVDSFVDNIIEFSNDSLMRYVESVKTDPQMSKYIKTLAERSGCSYDDAARYLALSSIKKNQKTVSQQIKSSFGSADNESIQIGKEVDNAFNNILDNELDQARLILGDNDLTTGDVFEEVKKLSQDIEGYTREAADTTSEIIATTDSQGRKIFIQTDPATATLYKTSIDHIKRPEGVVAKTNRLFSKIFRFGTTGANLSSAMRQWFRDTGNAVEMGGAFRTVRRCSDELVDDLGERIVSQLSDYDYAQYLKRAEETGQTVEQVAVAGELRRGQVIAGQTTEAELYTQSLSKLDTMKSKASKAYEKVEDIFNNKRENYLRNRVYANNLTKALEQGKTLEQARVVAEFAMNNATTNFSRKLVHLQRIANSTPYFSAAINGSKSFWRMVSLDPVGISTRIMAGLVVPQMALTASSLADPENRQVYENLPEYTKSENLVFVQNGIAITIPIPQELAFIVDPFRQFVESLYGANKNDFWELAANDILGVSPVDLTGFTAVDMDNLIADPTVFDRLGRGAARVFSQVAPIPVKSTYMIATGIDPYTGKQLRDSSRGYWNEDTQSYETMDYNQSALTSMVAGWFGEDTNKTIVSKVLSGILGNTNMDVLDSVVSTFQKLGGNENANPLSGIESQLGRIGSSITADNYNQLNSEWRRAIAQLEQERDAIMNSKEMQAIQSQLSQTDNEETFQKLIARRKDLLADWQKRVSSTVQRLGEQSGTLDRYKFASVVQLLNMDSTPSWAINNKYLQNLASQNYYSGRNQAYEMLDQMGIQGPNDFSTFGYVKYKDGEPTVVYNTPTSIITAGNLLYNESNINKANIESIIKTNNLYDERSKMYNQVNAIYNKGKLKTADYNAIDAIKMEYNNRVLTAIAPYLEKVSSEAITENEQIMDVLENLIQVPSAYEKVNNRFVSSGGGKLNKQQGFVRSYIKAILKENK